MGPHGLRGGGVRGTAFVISRVNHSRQSSAQNVARLLARILGRDINILRNRYRINDTKSSSPQHHQSTLLWLAHSSPQKPGWRMWRQTNTGIASEVACQKPCHVLRRHEVREPLTRKHDHGVREVHIAASKQLDEAFTIASISLLSRCAHGPPASLEGHKIAIQSTSPCKPPKRESHMALCSSSRCLLVARCSRRSGTMKLTDCSHRR